MNEDFRVSFMIIGAQKSGTTSLAEQLGKHPDICFCKKKEPAYFNTVQDWRSGLENYHKLYAPGPRQICGEASTSYTFIPEYDSTHSRLFEYNPGLKLIYMMRDPIERIRSHYAHRVATGRVSHSPEVSIFSDPAFVNRSRYALQIRPYLDLFGAKNILMLIFEEYIANQVETLSLVSSFLGISGSGFNKSDRRPKNRSNPSHKPKFSTALKKQLWQLLKPEIELVEQWFGRPVPSWRIRNAASPNVKGKS